MQKNDFVFCVCVNSRIVTAHLGAGSKSNYDHIIGIAIDENNYHKIVYEDLENFKTELFREYYFLKEDDISAREYNTDVSVFIYANATLGRVVLFEKRQEKENTMKININRKYKSMKVELNQVSYINDDCTLNINGY